jgi:hypothetical protein
VCSKQRCSKQRRADSFSWKVPKFIDTDSMVRFASRAALFSRQNSTCSASGTVEDAPTRPKHQSPQWRKPNRPSQKRPLQLPCNPPLDYHPSRHPVLNHPQVFSQPSTPILILLVRLVAAPAQNRVSGRVDVQVPNPVSVQVPSQARIHRSSPVFIQASSQA